MFPQKLLGLATLAAAAAMAPAAFAAPESGSLASCTITIRHLWVDGLPATRTMNLAGDAVTQVSTCSGRVRKTIVHGGGAAPDIVTTATYDAGGLPLSRRDATGAGTDYAYDALGRKVTETDAAIAGKVRRYAYDLANQLISATDPLGVVTTYGYDARGRKISEFTPMNGAEVRLIRYGYDGRGLMTTLTDANGAVTTWAFDELGRQVAKTYANGDHRSMAYDAAGRLVALTDENGRVTTSVYDLASRLIRKEFGSLVSDLPSPVSDIDTYAYDAASRLTAVTKGRYAHTLRYAYDPAGRLAAEIHPDGRVVSLRYDAAGRLRRLFLANGETSYVPAGYDAAYAYESHGLLGTVTAGDYATRYEYRANGQLASTIDYRTIDPQADILRADRTYDAGARLLEVANTAANGDQDGVRYTLGLDDQRVEALEESGQKWQYGYDSLKQLVSAKKTDTAASVVAPLDQSYTYDPMGNRRAYTEQGKSIAYTANSANQYTGLVESSSVSSVPSVVKTPVYDKNGNMLSDGEKNYTWDAENQLIAVSPVTPAEGAKRVEYAYDWRMRRTAKKSYTYTAGAWALTATHEFKYHEWNPIRETINSHLSPTTSVTTKSYVWGNDLSGNLHGAGGVGGLLSMAVSSVSPITSQLSTDRYFYAYDGNGNVRALVKANAANPTASAVVERYAYDGFGRELSSSLPLAGRLSPFAFSTKYLDAETGMNYYGYRFYAADAGRWINRDPISEGGGANLYRQVGNNAIYGIDVDGLILFAIGGTDSVNDNVVTGNMTAVLRFRNSYDESQGPADYVDGPSITGAGLQAAVDKGISFITTEWCKCKRKPIDLVGHSRGGHGVIMIATALQSGVKCSGESSLSFPRIRFMGLYDAVAMYLPTGGAMDIPSNVESSYHAVRDPATTSRAGWGNSGKNRPMKPFMGNHSAIGGDPEHGDRITYMGNGNSGRGLRAGFYDNIDPYVRPGGLHGFDETIYPNQVEVNAYNNGVALNRIASRESDAYIRAGAGGAGVKLK